MAPLRKELDHPVVGHVCWEADEARSGAPVRFLDHFTDQIEEVTIPQLVGVSDRRIGDGSQKFNGRMKFYGKAIGQLLAAWDEVERAGLTHLVTSFAGSFVLRLQKKPNGGRVTKISNHAYGTAFDINNEYNPQGHTPPAVGQPGSVRLLVPIFEKYGFKWGGHFSPLDGMHFEVARLLVVGHQVGSTPIDIFKDGVKTPIPALLVDDHVWAGVRAFSTIYGGALTKVGGSPFSITLQYQNADHILAGRLIGNTGYVRITELAAIYGWTCAFDGENRRLMLA